MPKIEIEDTNDNTLFLTDEFKKFFDTLEYRDAFNKFRNMFAMKFIYTILRASNIIRSGSVQKAANYCVVNVTNAVLLRFASYVFVQEDKNLDFPNDKRIYKIGSIYGNIAVYVDSNMCGTDRTVLVGYYDENDENDITVDKMVTFNCQY